MSSFGEDLRGAELGSQEDIRSWDSKWATAWRAANPSSRLAA